MPWGQVDDNHYDHPKVLSLPRAIRNAADGLYWRAISRCNRILSDGWLTPGDLELIDAEPELVDALITARLWERKGDRIRVHDFLVFNKSRAEVLKERAAKAAAGRAGGLASGRARAKKAGSVDAPEVRTPRRERVRSKNEAGASNTVEPPTRPPSSPNGEGRVGTSPPATPAGGGPVPPLSALGVPPLADHPRLTASGRRVGPIDVDIIEAARAKLADPGTASWDRALAAEQLQAHGVAVES